MHRHILIATDGSDLSAKAVTDGVRLAKALDAKLTVLTVATTQWPIVVEGVVIGPSDAERTKSAKDQAARVLDGASTEARKLGVVCDTLSVLDHAPYQAIIDAAQTRNCDLIVMASHGRSGFKALLLGSETQKVLAHSNIPVLVHR